MIETALVKELRDTAARETKFAPDPFASRKQTLWWRASDEIERLHSDLKRLWHFAGCPYEHCETCIADAEWIKILHDRLGPPSAESVQAQHDAR